MGQKFSQEFGQRCALAVALSAAFAVTSTVYAQGNEQQPATASAEQPAGVGHTLPPVKVTARPLSGQTENTGLYSPGLVGAGAKTEQRLREIPRSISVLPRQQLDDQNINSLNEALEQLPGVTVEPGGQWSGDTWHARGFEITSVLVDGSLIREKDWMDSSSNASLAMYDNVQLLRGPDSLFSGNGEPSGSINLVRKRPLSTLQTKVALSAGSWNNYRGEFDITGPLTAAGNIRGRFVTSYTDTEKFWDNAERRNYMLYGVVDVDLGSASTLSLGASKDRKTGSGRDSAPPGLPRYSNGAPLPLSRSQGSPDYDYRNSDAHDFFARLEHAFSENWKMKLNLSHTENSSDIRFAQYNGAVAPGKTTGTMLMVRAGDTTSKANGVDAHLSGKFNLFDRDHEMVVGADWLLTKNENNRGPQMFTNGAGNMAIDWATFDPKNPPALGAWRLQNPQKYEQERLGAYGYGKFQLHGPLKMILGGRYSSYKLKHWWRNPTELAQKNDSSGTFTPYYALTWDFSKEWTAYLSMVESFEDQSDKYTVNYSPLSEVTGRSWELGVKGELFDGALNTSMALYQTKRKNYAVKLYTDPNFDEDGLDCCYAGDGKFTSRGVEIDVSGALTPNLQINAGYTYDDNETDYGANDGKRYASYTPKHMLRLWAAYRLSGVASGWRIGGGVKAQSKVFRSGTVRTYRPAQDDWNGPAVPYDFVSPGRAVWNAFASYRFNSQWNLTANVNNVFDKKYFRSVGSTAMGNIYGEPRSFMLTLRGAF